MTTLTALEIVGARGPRSLVDQTVRVVTRVTGAGQAIRVEVGNRYGGTPLPGGTRPLHIVAATAARRAQGAGLVTGTVRTLTFAGAREVTVAPGETTVSDVLALSVEAGEDLAISMQVESAAVPPAHGASAVTSFVTAPRSGDHTADLAGGAFTERTSSTPIVTAVDVRSARLRGTIAVTGGSTVDGTGSTLDGHNDFPSQLSSRIRRELPPGRQQAVVNQGIGGTTAASGQCSLPAFGPSVDERLAHDTLGTAGLTHLVVVAGTNDIGFGCTGDQIIGAFRSILRQAAQRRLIVLISTITPRTANTAVQNAERAKVNDWVRAGRNCSGECDRSLDFDAVVRDRGNPNQIDPSLDSGDGIHPNPEGYRREAESVPLDVLRLQREPPQKTGVMVHG